MHNRTMKRATAIAIVGAVALGACTPSWAAPVFASTTAVRDAVPSATSDVRYRGYRGRYHRNNGAAIALGVLGVAGAVAGAAAYDNGYYGNRRYRQGYYGNPGYYQQGYYGNPYRY